MNGASLGISTGEDFVLPEGTLQLLVELDGVEFFIECPADADGCSPAEGEDTPIQISARRGVGGATVELSANQPGDMPTEYRFQVFLADEQILDESGSFDYDETQPNGPDCGPTCRFAESVVYLVSGVDA